MRPARTPVSKKHLKLAQSIDRARRCGFEPEFQKAVKICAQELAEHVVPSERASFFLACGIDTHTNDA